MNIVFGGVFNPPTIAHYKAAELVLKTFDVDHFVFLPVGKNYVHKDIAESEHRYQMVQLMADELGAEVSRLEIESDMYLGSYESMRRMEYSNIWFLMGTDNLKQFSSWKNTERLLSEFGLIVLKRQEDVQSIIDSSPLLKKYEHNIIVVNQFEYDVSSTNFRESRNEELVLSSVKEYIDKHGLYRG